jgi:hypothetical protein
VTDVRMPVEFDKCLRSTGRITRHPYKALVGPAEVQHPGSRNRRY